MRVVSPKRQAKVLIAAADLIDQYGWQYGSNGSKDEGFCASGAILEVTRGFWRSGRLRNAAFEALVFGLKGREGVNDWSNRSVVMSWNDSRDDEEGLTGHQIVVNKLREVAASLVQAEK